MNTTPALDDNKINVISFHVGYFEKLAETIIARKLPHKDMGPFIKITADIYIDKNIDPIFHDDFRLAVYDDRTEPRRHVATCNIRHTKKELNYENKPN